MISLPALRPKREISGFRAFSQRVGLSKAALYCYHRPLGLLRQSVAEGGPYQQWRTEQGRLAMIEAAERVRPLLVPEINNGASVAFLSGSRYWYQTVFCFASLQIRLPFRVTPTIFDDGSLDQPVRDAISRVIPWAQYISADEIDSRLDQLLPENKFPRLRERRREYAHLRKLVDIHATASSWTLVFDSDMLAFCRPEALITWFERPCVLYMQDVETSYGYPNDFLAKLAGHVIPERVNVGLYALYAPTIDWDAVEYWCARQLDDYGPSYLQEQALTALLIARGHAKALPDREYRVLPELREGKCPTAVLHHYVAYSKRAYYQFGWRRIERELRGLGQNVTPNYG